MRTIRCGTLMAVLCGAPALAQSPAQPVWEVGPALGVVHYPDYRGARNDNLIVIPAPYLVYRGERVRISRDGIKAELIEGSRLELSLSAGFSLPGDDDDPDSPRAGMPELLPTFEVGPSLDWWLREPVLGRWNWRLRLPVRAVAATDLRDFEHAGWLAVPHLRVDRGLRLAGWGVNLGASAGALIATRKYHAYFYEVPPEFATAERPAYDAEGGYSGTRLGLSVGATRGRWRVGLGAGADLLSGAAFEDSPLVQTDRSLVIGAGISYRLWASDQVVVEDEPEN